MPPRFPHTVTLSNDWANTFPLKPGVGLPLRLGCYRRARMMNYTICARMTDSSMWRMLC